MCPRTSWCCKIKDILSEKQSKFSTECKKTQAMIKLPCHLITFWPTKVNCPWIRMFIVFLMCSAHCIWWSFSCFLGWSRYLCLLGISLRKYFPITFFVGVLYSKKLEENCQTSEELVKLPEFVGLQDIPWYAKGGFEKSKRVLSVTSTTPSCPKEKSW